MIKLEIRTSQSKILWAGLFAITMGYFEAALVEYLRELYYPTGFDFPLRDIPLRIGIIELGREVMSMLMLLAVAGLSGVIFIDRFAMFCYCFGIWDLTYYLGLKIFENWPASLLTTDLLFLIPAPWVGPVWAPVGVSLALIYAAVVIWTKLDQGIIFKPQPWEWVLEILAGTIIIGSFLVGASAALTKQPQPAYPWYLWVLGMLIGLLIFQRVAQRSKIIENKAN